MAPDGLPRRQKTPHAPHSPFNLLIGKRIRTLRVGAGKSLSELGALFGLTSQQVHKYETGASRFSIENLWRLAQFFDVDITFFLEGVAREKNPKSGKRPSSSRLRLEIARDLERVESRKVLRSFLGLVRSVAVEEPEQAPP